MGFEPGDRILIPAVLDEISRVDFGSLAAALCC